MSLILIAYLYQFYWNQNFYFCCYLMMMYVLTFLNVFDIYQKIFIPLWRIYSFIIAIEFLETLGCPIELLIIYIIRNGFFKVCYFRKRSSFQYTYINYVYLLVVFISFKGLMFILGWSDCLVRKSRLDCPYRWDLSFLNFIIK